MKKIPIKQQIINAYLRGLSIQLISEMSGKTIKQVQKIIREYVVSEYIGA